MMKAATLLWIAMLLVACGGGGGGGGGGGNGNGTGGPSGPGGAGDPLGTDATLSGLGLSTGSLSPNFESSQTSYSAEVVTATLGRRAMIFARRKGLNLNTVVSDALRRYLDREDQVT